MSDSPARAMENHFLSFLRKFAIIYCRDKYRITGSFQTHKKIGLYALSCFDNAEIKIYLSGWELGKYEFDA